jgi:hypothetical protein
MYKTITRFTNMKKIIPSLFIVFLLTGCAEYLAILGPASSIASGGNVVQSSVTSAVNYGVKKQTGKTPSGHALSYIKEHNPEKEKANCITFINSTSSEACAALKNNIIKTKKKIVEKSNIKFLNTKQ